MWVYINKYLMYDKDVLNQQEKRFLQQNDVGKTEKPESRPTTSQIFFFPNLWLVFCFVLFYFAYGVFLQCGCFSFLFVLWSQIHWSLLLFLSVHHSWESFAHFEIKTILIFSSNTLWLHFFQYLSLWSTWILLWWKMWAKAKFISFSVFREEKQLFLWFEAKNLFLTTGNQRAALVKATLFSSDSENLPKNTSCLSSVVLRCLHDKGQRHLGLHPAFHSGLTLARSQPQSILIIWDEMACAHWNPLFLAIDVLLTHYQI